MSRTINRLHTSRVQTQVCLWLEMKLAKRKSRIKAVIIQEMASKKKKIKKKPLYTREKSY